MALTLRVTSFHNQALGADSTKVFGPQGGSIGRSLDNDWVLPDPEKFVSSHHAEIVCRGDNFALKDVSTNGTFVNGSTQPVGSGAEHPLVSGDRIQIADYEIMVALDAVAQHGATGPTGGAAWQPPGGLTGPSVPYTNPPVAATDDIMNMFDPAPATPTPGRPGVQADHVSPLDQNFIPQAPQVAPLAPPVAPASDGNFIPEGADWDQTTFESSDDAPGLPGDPFDAQQFAPAAAPPQQLPPAQPAPLPGMPTGQPPSPAAVPLAAGGEQQAIVAMLMSAGLDQGSAQTAVTPENLQALGEILGITTQGLIDVLTARSAVKSQFRVPMTMMRPVENNALKSSANAGEALLKLLVMRNPAYMNAADSFSEGFADVKAHQMAMMAGMRAAFDSMLDRFNPEELEQRFKKLKGKSMLRLPGGGQNWDMYKDLYDEMTQDADASFQRLFGEEFARAYEDQMQRLTAARGTMKV